MARALRIERSKRMGPPTCYSGLRLAARVEQATSTTFDASEGFPNHGRTENAISAPWKIRLEDLSVEFHPEFEAPPSK